MAPRVSDTQSRATIMQRKGEAQADDGEGVAREPERRVSDDETDEGGESAPARRAGLQGPASLRHEEGRVYPPMPKKPTWAKESSPV
jgi:hypothetical protein